jgi:hypothetical protein
LDLPVVAGPLDKDRREDLQLFSALQALSLKGFTRSPLNVELGLDPPDRWLWLSTECYTVGGHE